MSSLLAQFTALRPSSHASKTSETDVLVHQDNSHDEKIVYEPVEANVALPVLSRKRKAASHDSATVDIRTFFASSAKRPKLNLQDALVELDAVQFQNRLRGPVGRVHIRKVGKSFVTEYSATSRDDSNGSSILNSSQTEKSSTTEFTEVLADAALAVSDVKKASSATSKRPRRHAAKSLSFEGCELSSSDHEVEIAARLRRKPASAGSGRRRPRLVSKSSRGNDADSDFKAPDSGLGSDVSDDTAGEFDDGSSVTSISEDESPQPKTGRKHMIAHKAVPRVASTTQSWTKPTSKRMESLLTRKAQPKGLDHSLAPLVEIDDIFLDITKNALSIGLESVVNYLKDRKIKIATMCSGTESPLLALEMIDESLKSLTKGGIEIEHLFSAEIVPFKQAYIERNFAPPIIFRDITELTDAVKEEAPHATTAYGGKVPVPVEVSILIAGTSCVDMSRLNRSKKDLDGGGESDETWHAVLAYCQAFRPAIVLLENVRNADWDRMLTQYEEIGYESSGVLVDTKDYYIPQTRQRGYMACFDSKRFPVGLKGVAAKWQRSMASFRRLASAPVSCFLLPHDEVQQQQIRSDDPVREVDWSVCEISQMEYRQTKRLGVARPITNWSESGSLLPPEDANRAWHSRQSERVNDTIDCAHLRNALPSKGMFDSAYKTRIWNLSQNIYRDEDSNPFGIAGCITPAGTFWSSDSNRVLSPEETLKLQGLPLEKISFTTETPSEMQDLAGNAMSTTVIGSSVLSALIAGFRMLPEIPRAAPVVVVPEQRKAESGFESYAVTKFQSGQGQLTDLQELLDLAEKARRRCSCESSNHMTNNALQQCQDCLHTACISCGGNPVHRYRQNDALGMHRLRPVKFEHFLRSRLPLRVHFEAVTNLRTFLTAAKTNRAYLEATCSAVAGSFAFEKIRRTHCWTVLYAAPGARLDLVIESRKIEWRLYVQPPTELASNNRLRDLLVQPVGKCKLETTLFGGQWVWRTPASDTTALSINGHGSRIASWWCRNGMPDFTNHFVWEYLDIQVNEVADDSARGLVCGTFKNLPFCGKACGSLYVKVDERGEEPLYLFLDPTRTGHPDEDCFVLSRSNANLEYDEIRPVIARIPKWRPWSQNPNQTTAETFVASLVTDGTWNAVQTSLQSSETELTVQTPSNLNDLLCSSSCSKACVLLNCRITAHDGVAKLQEETVVRANDTKFFAKHAWMFEAIRRFLPSNDWSGFENEDATRDCALCVPDRPALRWKLGEDGQKILPYDDASSAATYERAIKSRSDAITTVLTPASDGSSVTIGINIVTLAQRASKRLLTSINDMGTEGSTISCAWRMNTLAGSTETFSFRPFHLRTTDGIMPFPNDLQMSVKLFPKQLLSLAWMKQQEAGEGAAFVVEEIEEASIKALKWRLEVRAQKVIKVRGGICADHPGFGKTITSLALIHAQFLDEKIADIERDVSNRQSGLSQGLIPLAATLIVCPNSLLVQWVQEIEEKLRYTSGVLKIASMADLSKYRIKDFQKAKIIVVNRTVLASEGYTERLAAFAAVPGPATNSGRSFLQWLKFACQQIPPHIQILQQQGAKKLQQHVQQKYDENIRSETFKGVVPSRRLRGQAYVTGKEKRKSNSAQKTKATLSDVETRYLDKPLFEMFCFNRLIVDEFHQYEPKEYSAIVALKADKRWGLSATPAMGDFYEMNQMAGLLGIPLRLGSDSRGIMKTKSVRELRKDATDFELFDAMRQKPSDNLQARIYEQDQNFLDLYVRQNIMDFEEMPYQDHLVPVVLDLDHRALYTELCQHLNSLDMRIRKGNKAKATHREKLFSEAVDSAQTAEEALSKAAAWSERTGDRGLGLGTLIRRREEQAQTVLDELPSAIAAAKKTEKDNFDKWVASRVQNQSLGDGETMRAVLDMLSGSVGAAVKSKATKTSFANDNISATKAKGSRAQTARDNGLCTRLLTAKRSLRYLQNIQQLQSSKAVGGTATVLCGNPECTRDVTTDIAVSAFCGHPVCQTCYTDLKRRALNRCPAVGCASSLYNYHLLWSSKMGNLQQPTTSPFGAKLEAVISLVQRIQTRGDQAILFVQYATQLDEADAALHKAGIPATIVRKLTEAGPQIADFRETSSDPPNCKTIIVLNVSDETAAGSNLQNANHVIFLSPLLRDTQYGYDATMAQAIGRVRRHGQTKPIHVYRILALDTIDVDILEHRERRRDALTEEAAQRASEPPPTLDQPREKTQLVREDGKFSLRPQSWLVQRDERAAAPDGQDRVRGRSRVLGWEDFSSLVKFSRVFTEDD